MPRAACRKQVRHDAAAVRVCLHVFYYSLHFTNLCWNLWLWLAPQSVCVCMYAHSDGALGSILQNWTMLGFRRLVSVTVIEVTVYKHREGEKSCSVFYLTQWYSLDECVCRVKGYVVWSSNRAEIADPNAPQKPFVPLPNSSSLLPRFVLHLCLCSRLTPLTAAVSGLVSSV